MLHPRRLKGMPGNIARYYAIGDYYTKGRDETSAWGGAIAAELGLLGEVDAGRLKELLSGKVGDQQLGRHRRNGEIQHQPGWDFAISAPKSVSIMALVAGDTNVLAAHEQAVGTALAYLEEHAALRRREAGEIVHETTGRLVYARFTEHASRALDPHLHTHVVVLNLTSREAGAPLASLETRAMFAEQMVAGQVYRNELAALLRERGYAIDTDPRSGLFEIGGVPRSLIDAMSRRAEQIEAHAREHGHEGQAARRISFFATRGPKEHVDREALDARWAARAGKTVEELRAVIGAAQARAGPSDPVPLATAQRAMLFGIRQAETREAVNNLGRMLRLALASHVGEIRLDDVRPLVEAHEDRRKLLATRLPTGDEVHHQGRTSRRTARLEMALSDHLALGLNDAAPIADPACLTQAIAGAGLNAVQEAALRHVGSASDRITGVEGVAGSGKSTLIRALNEAAGEGASLIALAPTSSAAANLGASAGIPSRTVASLIQSGGHGLDARNVLVLDEAGQLGNRQALRVLEISRLTGARLILLGDDKQTGAIEQGKAFWLLQQLGLSRASLTESVRQETRAMKAAVTQARLGNYEASIGNLDKVVTGDDPAMLAKALVGEWTRLKPENRANTNILVLDNATRLIVNLQIRDALRKEGVVAAEETRLSIIASAGMTDQEKRFARFYSGGQVVRFSRDNAGLGIAKDTEYRVVGTVRDARGRQRVQLLDEHGRTIDWDPRLGRTAQVNVFRVEQRALAQGDRIQWRLIDHDLGLKNAERGTVERLDGALATIRWDRDGRVQAIDLSRHKSWDHGYAETVYSAQSKTYDRVYVLAPVRSGLVNGQNYYTAITRARFGVKLWTEDPKRLVEKLSRRSGEKSSALEGLGRIDRDSVKARAERHTPRLERLWNGQQQARAERRAAFADGAGAALPGLLNRLARHVANNADHMVRSFDRYFEQVLTRGREDGRGPPFARPEPAGETDRARPQPQSQRER